MSDFNLKQATDFKINELAIVSKFGKYDVREMFEEINIFDGLLTPCISGNIIIKDAVGLSSALLLDGSELLLIDIDKGDGYFNFKRAFRVYKQTDRININQTSEKYLLHFVSDELILSNQQIINQAYEGTYAEIVVNILLNYLKVDNTHLTGYFDNSYGLNKFIMPNLTPLEAINYCSKRAIDVNGLPSFLFFENNDGYNFCTLSTIMSKDPLFDVNFDVKNLQGQNLKNEFVGARDIQVMTQFDFLRNLNSGMYSGSFVGFDPLTRTVKTTKYSFADIFANQKHGNDEANLAVTQNKFGKTNMQMENSRKVFFFSSSERQNTNYIKQKDADSLQKEDTPQKYVFQREALMQNFMAQRVRVVLPGNFLVSSGQTLNLDVPKRSFNKNDGDNYDDTLRGKYAILATRHIIKYNQHETVVDVVTDSTNKPLVQQSYQSLKEYENY
jgi:hypothetical protein